jgi:hypothetical protein
MSQVVEINCETGEQIVRDMTAAEIEQRNSDNAAELSRKAAEQAAIAAAEAARESARAKLAALGLTEAEVAALVK